MYHCKSHIPTPANILEYTSWSTLAECSRTIGRMLNPLQPPLLPCGLSHYTKPPYSLCSLLQQPLCLDPPPLSLQQAQCPGDQPAAIQLNCSGLSNQTPQAALRHLTWKCTGERWGTTVGCGVCRCYCCCCCFFASCFMGPQEVLQGVLQKAAGQGSRCSVSPFHQEP